jgi:hypothetical protein
LVQTITVWSIERSSLKIEMDKRDPAENSPSTRAAMDFRTLSDESRSLDLLNRYETRYDRQIIRSLNILNKLQAPDPNQFCRSEPIPNSDTECDRPPGLSPDPIKSAPPVTPPLPPMSSQRRKTLSAPARVLNRFGGQRFHKLCGAANPGCSRLLGGFCAVRGFDFRQPQKLSGGRFPAKSRRPQNG